MPFIIAVNSPTLGLCDLTSIFCIVIHSLNEHFLSAYSMPVWGHSEEHTKMSLCLGTVHVNRKDNHFKVQKQEVMRHIWRAE